MPSKSARPFRWPVGSAGVVSTVTCRRSVRLPEFEEIAQMGGGEAFLTSDERQIMTQLLILVFGIAGVASMLFMLGGAL